MATYPLHDATFASPPVASRLTGEERLGLVAAVVLHAGLLAVLLLRPAEKPLPPPERVVVTLSEDAALTSTSPDPSQDAAPQVAPDLGEPAPPEPAPAIAEPEPQPVARPEPAPAPVPKPVARPISKPVPRPAAKPSPKPVAKPVAKPVQKTASKPPAKPSGKPAAKPAATSKTATRSPAKAGGSKIGDNFLEGVPGASAAGKSRTPAASVAGPAVKSSLLGAISREIKPHWQGKVPEGADSEKLVTILRWNLNRDGSLAGTPSVVRQEGITDANRPQAGRHAEQAIRAVQLAAPFDLPDEYYDAWKRVGPIRFDKRLAQ